MAQHFPAAFEFMSSHHQADFPPHWSPPPHVAQANPVPPINDLVEVLIEESSAEWVREVFMEKFRNTTEQTCKRRRETVALGGRWRAVELCSAQMFSC
jgi:hypothetical protein